MGEVIFAKQLISRILENSEYAIILTTISSNASAYIRQYTKDNQRVMHQFCPIDVPYSVNRFFRFWKPEAGFMVESELWPNLLHHAAQFKIPMYLINAHISHKSWRRWRYAKSIFQGMVRTFRMIWTPCDQTFEFLKTIPNLQISHGPHLKFSNDKLPVEAQITECVEKNIRPIWVAASTHRGEELFVLQMHQKISMHFPRTLLIFAPRHASGVQNMLRAVHDCNVKMHVKIFSQCSNIQDVVQDAQCNILIMDAFGNLGLCYALGSMAFLGGSLINIGGHNFVEAIAHNCIPLFGPYMHKQKALFKPFQDFQSLMQQEDAHAIAQKIIQLWSSPSEYDDCLKKLKERYAQCQQDSALFLSDVLQHTLKI